MKLNLKDRILLMQVLPSVGKLKEIKCSKALSAVLLPTEEEQEKFEIQQLDGFIQWNPEVDNTVDINISEEELEFLKGVYSKLDADGKIDLAHSEMIDKLFGGEL